MFQLISLLCGLGEPYEYHNLGEFTRNGDFTRKWEFTWRVSDCEELVYYCLRFLRTTDKKEKANNN